MTCSKKKYTEFCKECTGDDYGCPSYTEAATKTMEQCGTDVQQLKPKMPSEGAFMEWAQSEGFNCSQAASTYDWFARHFGR